MNARMTDDRLHILGKYVEWLTESGHTAISIGTRLSSVHKFLNDAPSLDRRGYAKYKHEHAEDLIGKKSLRTEAILDFLAYLGKGYQRSEHKQKRAAPLEKLSTLSERNRQKLNEFIVWLNDANDFSPKTMDAYATGVKQFFLYSQELNTDSVKRYMATLEAEGRKPGTIQLRMSALKKYSEWAKIPLKTKRLKTQKSLDLENVPTESEYNRLLEYLSQAKDKKWYFIVKTAAMTGARISELLQIKWEDIASGEVTLKGKGNKYRRFFFPAALQKEVTLHMKDSGVSGWLCSSKYGGCMSDRSIGSQMKVWAKQLGICPLKMHPHAFRHFFAKMFLKSSRDVVQLSDLLGHGNLDTTRIYLQKSYAEQKKDIDRYIKW